MAMGLHASNQPTAIHPIQSVISVSCNDRQASRERERERARERDGECETHRCTRVDRAWIAVVARIGTSERAHACSRAHIESAWVVVEVARCSRCRLVHTSNVRHTLVSSACCHPARHTKRERERERQFRFPTIHPITSHQSVSDSLKRKASKERETRSIRLESSQLT